MASHGTLQKLSPLLAYNLLYKHYTIDIIIEIINVTTLSYALRGVNLGLG
jgi:hypothetical protein